MSSSKKTHKKTSSLADESEDARRKFYEKEQEKRKKEEEKAKKKEEKARKKEEDKRRKLEKKEKKKQGNGPIIGKVISGPTDFKKGIHISFNPETGMFEV